MITYHTIAFYLSKSFNRPDATVMGCILFSSESEDATERVTTMLREKHTDFSHQFTTMYFTHKYVDGIKQSIWR